MKKIIQCSDSFLPIIDGVGRVVYNYADKLARGGDECYVVTPLADAGYRGAYPFELIDFVSVKLARKQHYQTGIAQIDLHYSERISKIQPDIIHLHTPGFAGIEALRLAEKYNVPLVGTFHSKYYDDFLRLTHSKTLAAAGSRFVAEFYSRCDEVWTVSEDAATTLRSYGFRGEIVIMPNGTELKEPKASDERAAREAFGLDGEVPVMLYVGQIDFKKNLKMTIEAAAVLKRRGRAFRLVFAGQGQDREALEAEAERLGLKEEVSFTGHLSDPALLNGLYMAADLFVFPSIYDTAGLVVREAAVMGTPSVVVKRTAPSEVITDGQNGLVCENTLESLAEVIDGYLFKTSKAGREAMAAKAKATIPLGWNEAIKLARARYEKLVEKGRKTEPIFRPFESIENIVNAEPVSKVKSAIEDKLETVRRKVGKK